MRILQINTNFRAGGIQRHILDLTAFLQAAGQEVTLAGDLGEWALAKDDPGFVPLELNRVSALGGSMFGRIAALMPIVRQLRNTLKQRRIQLVHAHETAPALVAGLARTGLNIPMILTYHGSEPGRIASVARLARRFADLTVSPSRTSLDHLIDFGVAREKTQVIGLGVKPLPPVDVKDVAAYRAQLLGGKGRYLVSSLSRLAPQKGIDMMIEVARKVADRRKDVVFAVGGHGPLARHVEQWALITGVSERVKFLGPVSRVERLLAASDLYLLTSRWEALPISIFEAFQSALPVVATDCGGVRELVDDRVGRMLQVGDVAGLAEAVLELIEDDELRRRLGQNALALSRDERFSSPAVHRSFLELYRGMIDGGLNN